MDLNSLNLNLGFIEEQWGRFVDDPVSVDEGWRQLFEAFDDGDLSALMEAAGGRVEKPAPPPWEELGPTGVDGELAAVKAHVAQPSVESIGKSEILDLLRPLALFREMPDDELARVAAIARSLQFEDGALLCGQGEVGADLFVITQGTVLIRRDGRILTTLGEGEVVGELAVIDQGPRSADVIAKGTVRTLQLRGGDFHELLERHSSLTLNLLGVLAQRVREASHLQARVDSLVRAYRERGHVMATLDPLGRDGSDPHPELTLEHYGLSESDLDRFFTILLAREMRVLPLRDILSNLESAYCGAVGVQYTHIDDLAVQDWLRIRMEDLETRRYLTRDEQLRILEKLTDAEIFESFLHRKYVGAKRFSLEGAESLIPLMDLAIEEAGAQGATELVIGMPHRGRLNVLVNCLEKPPSQIFREFEDVDPELHRGRGDVKYHMGHSSDRLTASGQTVHLSLCFNPSHLEFVGPVVLGRTRAKQDRHGDAARRQGIPIIIHGDAAFAGQGVVQELFNLSQLPGYTTGGAIHIIVNNQIGFTTNPEEGRSSQYATDVARMLQIPVFHVNGEHPDAVAQVIRWAVDFRNRFSSDVVIDMYCYRKYGHNEGDDPTFTQPLMYKAIRQLPTVREAYVGNLLKLGEVSQDEADEIAERSRRRLEEHLEAARQPDFEYLKASAGAGLWQSYCGGAEATAPEAPTHLPRSQVVELLGSLSRLPDSFEANRKVRRLLDARGEMAGGEQPIDWGAAEALAYASLLVEGFRVRLCGQDVGRGTFSHRHAVILDQETGEAYIPHQHLAPGQAPFEVFNSPLTETGVLGFEYGYSLDYPDGLCVWEAQFGDFCNVAQVIIDQFISSGEDKWRRLSGLVMLLPHGFEGQGPEHSSARLERFLMLAAEDNMQVVNLTTPAQLFHCLRRQVVRPWRKPLVVMSPKSLLRHPAVVSDLSELAEGRFHRVIGDEAELDSAGVRRILLCGGKVYYDLRQAREEAQRDDIAIIRLEQYYPLDRDLLQQTLAIYPEATPVVWVQEEPENMGAWPFVVHRLGATVAGNGEHPLELVSRVESASPATGSAAAHKLEQQELMARALDV